MPVSSARTPRDRTQECLNRRQDIFDDDVNSLRGRVHAIGLIEFGIACYPREEKRIKRHAGRFGDIRIDGIETGGEIGAVIWRSEHPAEQDNYSTRLQP